MMVQPGKPRRCRPGNGMSEAGDPGADGAGAPLAFHVLAKPTGPICNLDCEYCFFLSKEALYPGDRFRMADDLLETYLRQYSESQPDGEVTIAWQGGEPTLMGVDFFRRAVELAERYRRPGPAVQHTIQTNGTLLPTSGASSSPRDRFLVGISIDGPPGSTTLPGRQAGRAHLGPGAARASAPAGARGRRQHPVHRARGQPGTCRSRSTATSATSSGAAFIQFIPIVERVNETGTSRRGNRVTDRSVDPVAWGAFLEARVRRVGPPRRRHGLRAAVRRGPGLVVRAALDAVHLPETCGDALALEHNGDLYSCDHFVEPGYLLGNIATPTWSSWWPARQRAFGRAKRDTLPGTAAPARCASPATASAPRTASPPPPTASRANYLCAGYKRSSPTSTGRCG